MHKNLKIASAVFVSISLLSGCASVGAPIEQVSGDSKACEWVVAADWVDEIESKTTYELIEQLESNLRSSESQAESDGARSIFNSVANKMAAYAANLEAYSLDESKVLAEALADFSEVDTFCSNQGL